MMSKIHPEVHPCAIWGPMWISLWGGECTAIDFGLSSLSSYSRLRCYSPWLCSYFNPSAWRLLAATMLRVWTTALKQEQVETVFLRSFLECDLEISRENWFGTIYHKGVPCLKISQKCAKIYICMFFFLYDFMNAITSFYGNHVIIPIFCNSFLQFSAWGCVCLACVTIG